MLRKISINLILILTGLLIFIPFNSFTAGLKVSLAEVLFENLQIGKSYSIIKMANLPFEVINTSEKSTRLSIKPVMPNKIRPGFEPIPDLNWIELSKTNFILKPNESAKSDIIIKIPNNKKYLGKKYEVDFLSTGQTLRSKAMFGFEVELQSRLLFTICKLQVDNNNAKIKNKINLNFNVSPLQTKVSNIDIGKKIDLSQKGIILKIENLNEESYNYEIKSLAIQETVSSIPDDFLPCPDTQFLSFSDSYVKVGPKQTKNVKMFLDFSDNKQYRNKKYMFIISVKVKNKGVAGNRYVRLYVTTKK